MYMSLHDCHIKKYEEGSNGIISTNLYHYRSGYKTVSKVSHSGGTGVRDSL